jgi:probable rRNA maturation factor
VTTGPKLEINDHYGRALEPGFVAGVVAAALSFAGRQDCEVSLLLTDEAEIASVHDQFMGDPTGTDVISFPSDEGVDMVVSVERAERESTARGHAFQAELALYIVHGILHVCGFDDTTDVARVRMRDAERSVLDSLGLRVAPVDE